MQIYAVQFILCTYYKLTLGAGVMEVFHGAGTTINYCGDAAKRNGQMRRTVVLRVVSDRFGGDADVSEKVAWCVSENANGRVATDTKNLKSKGAAELAAMVKDERGISTHTPHWVSGAECESCVAESWSAW